MADTDALASRHLTVAEVAERFQVPIGTVYRWSYVGKGPRAIKVGKHLRYRLKDVEAWEESLAVERRTG